MRKRVPLLGGSYTSPSPFLAVQRCANLVPEPIPQAQGEPLPSATMPRPGLTLLTTAPNNAAIRGIHAVSTFSQMYIAAADKLYKLRLSTTFSPTWTLIGTLSTSTGPFFMADNGTTLLGGDVGNLYTVDLNTAAFATLAAAGPPWGASGLDYVDTYFVVADQNQNKWYVSGAGTTTFNGLDVVVKSAPTDIINTIKVVRRNIWVFGEYTTEVWVNNGGSGGTGGFPFVLQPGTMIPYGCMYSATVATINNTVLWLAKDATGKGIVMMGAGLEAQKISTYAVDSWLNTYVATRYPSFGGGSAPTAFTMSHRGHSYYVLNCPGDPAAGTSTSWVYDLTSGLWSEWTYLNPGTGLEEAFLGAYEGLYDYPGTALGTALIVGDRRNGNIYRIDTSTCLDNGNPIKLQRSFPHLQSAGGERIAYHAFRMDIQGGSGVLSLDWSDDAGQTFGNPITNDLSAAGTKTIAQWQRLGMARDRVFRVTSTSNMPNVAWSSGIVDIDKSAS